MDPSSKLEEEIIVRPTSETIIWYMFKKWVTSYRDLPVKINQWANVVRWEMRTRLFLRTSEFLWQEGHTAHATKEEALEETLMIVDIYKSLFEDYLAIPTMIGRKSNMERFAGADETYSIETMMRDKKALQAGTSHYLGTNFGTAFDVKFQSKENKKQPVCATSWGVSTRMIGALIMVHGDDKGLRLPTKVAPIQVVVIPIVRRDADGSELMDYLHPLISKLKDSGVRVHIDDRPKMSPGFKFNEWEMKGVPVRLEVGARDMENGEVFTARRDTGEKFSLNLDAASVKIPELLDEIQGSLSSHLIPLNYFHLTYQKLDNLFYIKTKCHFLLQKVTSQYQPQVLYPSHYLRNHCLWNYILHLLK